MKKYLCQLILTSIVLIMIPTVLFYNLVWNKSLSEVKNLNIEYYQKNVNTFFESFTNDLFDFKTQAIEFELSSRSLLESSVFFYGTEKMREKAYYYGEAAKYLSDYGYQCGYDDIGIYFFEEDILLYNKIKYDKEGFIKYGLQINEVEKNGLLEIFSENEFKSNSILIAPLYDEEKVSDEILVGVHVRIGKNKEKAMMFCRIDAKDSIFFNGTLHDENQIKYYIVDNETEKIIFSIGATKEDYDEVYSMLQNGINDENKGDLAYFTKINHKLGITFLLDSTEDNIQMSVTKVYSDVTKMVSYICILLICMCVFTVTMNYKPVYRLLKKIDIKGKNEFDTILNVWETQNNLLSQQRSSIIELLMSHLLYGIPLSEDSISKIGVGKEIKKYCVFVIKNYVLKAQEVTAITREIEESFETLVLVNDLIGEKSTVCIVFMKQNDAMKISNWIDAWCSLHITEKYELRMGSVVDELCDIHKSFAECEQDEIVVTQIPDDNMLTTVSDKIKREIILNEKLKTKIINYLDEHFMDKEMSQRLVADHFNISIYSLSKMFNNQVGVGFVEYVSIKRIEYAKELLISTEKTVKEIAYTVGFSRSNYFIEVFRKYVNMTPAEFRVNYKEKEEGNKQNEEK